MECPCCRQIEKGKWLFAEPVDQLEEDDMSPLDMVIDIDLNFFQSCDI